MICPLDGTECRREQCPYFHIGANGCKLVEVNYTDIGVPAEGSIIIADTEYRNVDWMDWKQQAKDRLSSHQEKRRHEVEVMLGIGKRKIKI